MLKHQPWLRYGRDLRVEYEQCLREGRDVAQYEAAVNALCALPDDILLKNEPAVEAMAEQLKAAPIRPDFPYEEPSELPAIFAASPSAAEKPVLPECPDEERLLDKLEGAWIGRIA